MEKFKKNIQYTKKEIEKRQLNHENNYHLAIQSRRFYNYNE